MKKAIEFTLLITSFLMIGILIFCEYYPTLDVNEGYVVRGNFDPSLEEYDSVNKFADFIDSYLDESMGDLEQLEIIDSIFQYRFHHGTARFNLSDDYFSYFLGKYIWDDMRMIVLPDALMRKHNVVCNQMSIVFQKYLKIKGFTYRTACINAHMITEVLVDGNWYAFDPDYEPIFKPRTSLSELLENKEKFKQIYNETNGRFFNQNFEFLLESNSVTYLQENIVLASNLRNLQKITWFLSYFGWIIPLLLRSIIKYF